VQESLFPRRISTIYPQRPQGADIAFFCVVDSGETYYCKDDKDPRLIRATEFLYTKLAAQLNIRVPSCNIIVHKGSSYFGSKLVTSSASQFEVRDFLVKEQLNEIGAPNDWLGRYFSSLYAYDMFIHNIDRSPQNFLLERSELSSSTLIAFDFASSSLSNLSNTDFPQQNTNTVKNGKFFRKIHGFDQQTAMQMLDNIASIPAEFITKILTQLPRDWLPVYEGKSACDFWKEPLIKTRISALRLGIQNGSLL
jgi:hypothetical protein